MTLRDWQFLASVAFAILVANAPSPVKGSTVINFDDVSIVGGDGNQSVFPGNLYANSGVLFSTGNLNTDTLAVGNTVTFAKLNDNIVIADSSPSAVSLPNMLLPAPPNNSPDPNLIFYDLLLTFTTPVTSVNVTSDRFSPETPDTIRLLALQATTVSSLFQVLALDQKFDDAVAPPGNLLAVGPGTNPFSYALIEIISENEGFDNLTFTAVPEPSTVVLAVLALLGVVICRGVFTFSRLLGDSSLASSKIMGFAQSKQLLADPVSNTALVEEAASSGAF